MSWDGEDFDFSGYDFPDPDIVDESDSAPEGMFINGQWYDAGELPRGYGSSPEWWDDDGFGETFEEYMEHED